LSADDADLNGIKWICSGFFSFAPLLPSFSLRENWNADDADITDKKRRSMFSSLRSLLPSFSLRENSKNAE
jgi:hypothetical protein